MAQRHKCFTQPSADTKLWRYMDFSKFVALLEDKSLFMPNVEAFEDKLEATMPEAQIKKREERLISIFGEEQAAEISKKSSIDSDLMELYFARGWFYVSCWHMNEFESAGMWKLYAKSNDAIAIQTTFERLEKSLPDEFRYDSKAVGAINMGVVKYIDMSKDVIDHGPGTNTYNRLLHKRHSFAHEQELRIIVDDARYFREENLLKRRGVSGINLPIKLEIALDSIFVAPTSPGWYRDLVRKVLNRYGYENVTLSRSDLDSENLK